MSTTNENADVWEALGNVAVMDSDSKRSSGVIVEESDIVTFEEIEALERAAMAADCTVEQDRRSRFAEAKAFARACENGTRAKVQYIEWND